MYAVVSSGGKQYRVEPGSTLTIERLAAEAGATLTFDRVLLIGDGDEVTVGTPVVTGASVSATVLGEELGPKLVIFKFKQKVKYRRRTGHRQHLMRVRIDAITADGKSTMAKAEPEVTAEAAPKARTARKAPAKSEPKATAESVEPEAAPAAPKRRPARAKTAAKAATKDATEDAEPAAEKPKAARKAAAPRRATKPKAEE
jgi:large subunit ribosomal protein L21